MKIFQSKPKPLRIAKTNIFSWQKRLTTFAGIFGTIWLFIDPLSTFSLGTNILKSWGAWGYLGLLFISGFTTFAIELVLYLLEIKRISFIPLTIIFTETGTLYDVEVPQDMRTEIFINLLFEKLSGLASDRIVTLREMYDCYILVQHNDTYEAVPPHSTFREAKINKHDKCKIRGVIKEEYRRLDAALPPELRVSQISLNWKEVPRDLDLYLIIQTGDETNGVFHSNLGSLDKAPWVFLDRDVRNGFGPENIQIKRWLKGKYTCIVQNFSGEIPLAGCGATVEFIFDGNIEKFTCPITGTGIFWVVFTYDSETRQLEAINEISNKPMQMQLSTPIVP